MPEEELNQQTRPEAPVRQNDGEQYILQVGSFQERADAEQRKARAALRRKMARQAARSVLPNATETKIFVTANARALRHFIELRCNEHADRGSGELDQRVTQGNRCLTITAAASEHEP